MQTSEILNVIDKIDVITVESEINICQELLNSYEKMNLIMENYNGDYIDSFSIFQEGVVDDVKKDMKETGKDKSPIMKILTVLPRLIMAVFRAIKSKIKNIKKKQGDVISNFNSKTKKMSKTDKNLLNKLFNGSDKEKKEAFAKLFIVGASTAAIGVISAKKINEHVEKLKKLEREEISKNELKNVLKTYGDLTQEIHDGVAGAVDLLENKRHATYDQRVKAGKDACDAAFKLLPEKENDTIDLINKITDISEEEKENAVKKIKELTKSALCDKTEEWFNKKIEFVTKRKQDNDLGDIRAPGGSRDADNLDGPVHTFDDLKLFKVRMERETDNGGTYLLTIRNDEWRCRIFLPSLVESLTRINNALDRCIANPDFYIKNSSSAIHDQHEYLKGVDYWTNEVKTIIADFAEYYPLDEAGKVMNEALTKVDGGLEKEISTTIDRVKKFIQTNKFDEFEPEKVSDYKNVINIMVTYLEKCVQMIPRAIDLWDNIVDAIAYVNKYYNVENMKDEDYKKSI